MTLPPTSPDPTTVESRLDRIEKSAEVHAEKLEKIAADVASLLEVFLKLWEQFNTLKDSPMLSAFFGPKKR